MNIIQAYQILKAIENHYGIPDLEVRYNGETYWLKTEKYDIAAQKYLGHRIIIHPVIGPYTAQPQTRYSVSARDNQSDKKITDDGFIAKILFKVLANKVI